MRVREFKGVFPREGRLAFLRRDCDQHDDVLPTENIEYPFSA
jgi:hypothetical protein